MPYSTYNKYYCEFHSENYDSRTKTIMVDIPDVKRNPFPKDWKRDGNRYFTPGGCEVIVWGSGVSENFLVRRTVSAHYYLSKTIHPGINARDNVISTVKLFESE